MKNDILLKPKYVGERFNAHSIPLTLLKELESLQGIVQEIARAQYLAANPNRRRIPKGFIEGLTLHLVGTEDGCFIPVLGIPTPPNCLPGTSEQFQRARAACASFLDLVGGAAEEGADIAPGLPESAWPYVDGFGRGLEESEAVLFESGQGQVVRYNKQIRRKLLLSRREVMEVSDEIERVARLGSADAEGPTIGLILSGERALSVSLSSEQFAELSGVCIGDFGKVWVRIRCVGVFDKAQRLLRLEAVKSVERLRSGSVAVQIEVIRQLTHGWLDGVGRAVDRSLLHFLEGWLERHLPPQGPVPRLFATPEGGVEAEWRWGAIDFSIEFDPHNKVVEWHALNLETDAVEEFCADLSNSDGLEEMGVRLTTFLLDAWNGNPLGEGEQT